jgi:transposase
MAKRSLVPETGGLRVVTIRRGGGGLVIEVEPREPPPCPRCGAISTSRHGAYIRALRDLPIQGDAVTLQARAGRWRCRSSSCVQRTFVAPLTALAYARQRRTRRLDNLAFLIGHALGGRPAERLARRLGVPVSRDIILTNLRRAVPWNAESGPTRVIGIDEWSRRKGSDFGSIIVDLERRQVIDVLPDRAASSVKAWMRNHPDIEYVVRDRDGLYAEGATKGAPQAEQVADRFHLLQNLRKTIEAELAGIRAPTGAVGKPPSLIAESGGNDRARTRMAGRDMRELMFQRVRSLHEAGESAEAIRLATGLGHRTVRRWIRLKTLPSRQRMAPKATTPSAFEAYLRRRWTEGCTHVRTLLAEVRELGFTGCVARLYAFLSPWRQADVGQATPDARATPRNAAPLETPYYSELPVMPRDPSTGGLISSIVAAALCVKPRGMLTESQKANVAVLKSSLPSFAVMRALAMRFRGMMTSGKADGLDAWLRDAAGSGIYGMRVFARGLRKDLAAVRNALTTEWSSGQVEGQINRLKTLKRAMYGRVSVEVLRARLLPLPHF